MFFCTNNSTSKCINLSCIIFLYEKLNNPLIQSFKECLFFVLCLFCFLLLSYNTLHVLHVFLYTYICYGNTFQYKYFIQITFHVAKQSHSLGKLTNISQSPSQITRKFLHALKAFLNFSFVCFC